ncbi:MAG: CDP-diacylglycerol--glycerol-3-phosphate 3-phosphatidyltransferase [Clostridia bacterium]|jgi:CDP-diacylglycerol--glycerol-3-phosphate 3-phosphatidyltransferase
MNIANKLTMLRIILVPFLIVFAMPTPVWFGDVLYAFHNTYGIAIALIIFIIAAFTDTLDGYYARKLKLVTNMGKFIDPIADKILVTAALIILVERGDIPGFVLVIIIARDLVVDGIRLIAAGTGTVIAASVFAKIKTALQMIAVGLYFFSYYFDIWFLPQIILILALIATVYSGIEYIKSGKEYLKR